MNLPNFARQNGKLTKEEPFASLGNALALPSCSTRSAARTRGRYVSLSGVGNFSVLSPVPPSLRRLEETR
jgi:hypothetical protein